MSRERSPGSNRGRANLDWENAFLFYASLPPERRDYKAVADNFGVSCRTVERHGGEKGWRDKARQLDRDTIQIAAERLKDERAKTLVDTEKLIEATNVAYAQQLVAGDVKIRPIDVVKMFELRERISALQDDRSVDERDHTRQAADPIDPTEHKLQVVRALKDAGAVARLLRLAVASEDDDSPENGDGQEPRAG